MKIKTLPLLRCLRCGHAWTPRQQDVRICPSCKTALWDKPKCKKGLCAIAVQYLTANGIMFASVLFDETCMDIVSRYSWYILQASNTMYASGTLKPDEDGTYVHKIHMHRLVSGNPKGKIVHHINCNGLDNRKENLEILTNSEHANRRRKDTWL